MSSSGEEEDDGARERQGGGPTWLPGPDVAWGPTMSRAPAVCGEGGLITQRFYAPAPAPPAVSDAATIMPKPNETHGERRTEYLRDYHWRPSRACLSLRHLEMFLLICLLHNVRIAGPYF